MLAVLAACPRERCVNGVASVGALALSPDAAAVAAWLGAAISWAHAADAGARLARFACAVARVALAQPSAHALARSRCARVAAAGAPGAPGAPPAAGVLHDALGSYLWAVAGPPALAVASAQFARGADVAAFAAVLADAAASAASEGRGADTETDLFLLRASLQYCAVRYRMRCAFCTLRFALFAQRCFLPRQC